VEHINILQKIEIFKPLSRFITRAQETWDAGRLARLNLPLARHWKKTGLHEKMGLYRPAHKANKRNRGLFNCNYNHFSHLGGKEA
jgi:hypothetical protein